MQNRLEAIRKTKLDLARWLAAGIENCGNPKTSLLLARYAAAQLEGAALIPRTAAPGQSSSLLRNALQKSTPPSGRECLRLLHQVSRAILDLLGDPAAGQAVSDLAIKQMIRHELQTAKLLTEMLPRKAAA